MPEMEGIGLCKLVPNPFIHGVYVCLVDSHALLRKGGGVIDWNLMELWVVRPILIQDKQQLLCSTKSICRDKNTPPLRNSVVDGIREALLSDMAGLVLLHAIS